MNTIEPSDGYDRVPQVFGCIVQAIPNLHKELV